MRWLNADCLRIKQGRFKPNKGTEKVHSKHNT